jgi:hypothetical protein
LFDVAAPRQITYIFVTTIRALISIAPEAHRYWWQAIGSVGSREAAVALAGAGKVCALLIESQPGVSRGKRYAPVFYEIG